MAEGAHPEDPGQDVQKPNIKVTDRRHFYSGELLAATGLLQAVLPEVAALQGVEQPAEFHPEGDVFKHTKLLMKQSICSERSYP